MGGRGGALWKGRCGNWEIHFHSGHLSIPRLFSLSCSAKRQQDESVGPLLPLQQLHRPEKQLCFVFGDGRYKLVLLTFQKTLLLLLILRSIPALPALKVILQCCPTDNTPSVVRGSPLCSETLPEFSPKLYEIPDGFNSMMRQFLKLSSSNYKALH